MGPVLYFSTVHMDKTIILDNPIDIKRLRISGHLCRCMAFNNDIEGLSRHVEGFLCAAYFLIVAFRPVSTIG